MHAGFNILSPACGGELERGWRARLRADKLSTLTLFANAHFPLPPAGEGY